MTWEIIDNTGTIHSGTEEEMKRAFDAMISTHEDLMEYYEIDRDEADSLIDAWSYDWEGDLKLIKVENIYR